MKLAEPERGRSTGYARAFLVAVFMGVAPVHAGAATPAPELKFPDAAIEPVTWSDLDGWAADDHAAAYATFLSSCRAIMPDRRNARAAGRLFTALKSICRRARGAPRLEDDKARAFFEENFRPVRISKLGEQAGFLTGYYEPIVDGSRFPTREFTVPLYRRPPDLIMLGQKRKGKTFANKGPVVRKVGRRKTVPYYDRAQIEDGALDGRRVEICWLKDPIDAFFIHIQGSARIRLEDGTMLRVNYDSHNGHPYTPVGRILIERGEIPREEMSMERIRQWMLARPEEGRALRRQNKSFIFFRVTGLSDNEEARGGQGVSLKPGRSIAVDRPLHIYGMPFWIEAELPIDGEQPTTRFRRLVVAQDTGSAIVGPARADIYFGAGDEAGRIAGRIRHAGRFAMLVPRELDPAARARVPLPPLRPAMQAAVASIQSATPLPPAKPKPDRSTKRRR
jgi:membrane-bound lytic murein transglycosylase A